MDSLEDIRREGEGRAHKGVGHQRAHQSYEGQMARHPRAALSDFFSLFLAFFLAGAIYTHTQAASTSFYVYPRRECRHPRRC